MAPPIMVLSHHPAQLCQNHNGVMRRTLVGPGLMDRPGPRPWLEPVSLILTLKLVLVTCLELLVMWLHLPAGLWTHRVRAMTHISAAPVSHLAVFAGNSSAPLHHRPAQPQVITEMGDLMVQQTLTYEHGHVLSGGEDVPRTRDVLPAPGADRRPVVTGRPHLLLAPRLDHSSRRLRSENSRHGEDGQTVRETRTELRLKGLDAPTWAPRGCGNGRVVDAQTGP